MVYEGKTLDVKTVVLPVVTNDLPNHRVRMNQDRKHLEGLPLADPTLEFLARSIFC